MMPFAKKDGSQAAERKTPATLMEETEKLITKLVRNARSGRVITETDNNGKPKTRRIQYDVIDQVRAANAALALLQAKNKLDPEVEENEFDKQLREFHAAGSGDANPAETANGGTPTAH